MTAARLTAFIGRSFLAEDDLLWREIREVLESLRPLGFEFEDAKEPQPRPISDKVREGIQRNNIYIGIISRRRALIQGSSMFGPLALISRPLTYSTSSWVVQESGYALGVGRPVLLLIEDAVDFPNSNLDADTEWLPFTRGRVAAISPRLVAMLSHFIAKTLPAAPSAGVASSQQTPASEEPVPASERPSLARIADLLDAGDVKAADQLVEKYRQDRGGRVAEFMPFYYLHLKAVRGIAGGLDELKSAIANDPGNVFARTWLAEYYTHFNRHADAAELLLAGVPASSVAERAPLQRRAAESLSAAGEHMEALKIIAALVSSLTDAEEINEAFISLADIAKDMGSRELEAGALERALELDPSDSTRRFRLAFLYSDMNQDHMALYHYKLRLSQAQDAVVLNNLGVSYSRLDMHGKEIEMFEAAASDSLLARANLAHAYVDRGFFTKSAELADQVLRGDPEAIDRDRAAAAVQLVTERRAREQEKEVSLSERARLEAEFRGRYGVAFVDGRFGFEAGIFEIRQGNVLIRQDGNRLVGDATYHERNSGLAGGLAIGLGAEIKTTRTRTITFNGELISRAGRFQLAVETTVEGALLRFPERTSVEGLFVVTRDGNGIEILEAKTDVGVYVARRVPATST